MAENIMKEFKVIYDEKEDILFLAREEEDMLSNRWKEGLKQPDLCPYCLPIFTSISL
jgi:hypothetical protein